jgi:hypothetical protein
MLYFETKDSERCYNKEYFQDMMSDNGLREMQVYAAKRVTGQGIFYCHEHQEVGESGIGDCGNGCKNYSPRNKKNGRCKHSGYCYEHGELVTIKRSK